jgi:hypothetical protein
LGRRLYSIAAFACLNALYQALPVKRLRADNVHYDDEREENDHEPFVGCDHIDVQGPAIILLAICMTAFVLALAFAYARIKLSVPNEYVGIAYGLVGLLFFVSFLYHIRFSQVERRVVKTDKKELMDNLDTSSISVKLFYFPLVIRWKVSEYFGLL